MKNRFIMIINLYKLPFFYLGFLKRKDEIVKDASRWIKKYNISLFDVFDLVVNSENFASVYNYRFRDNKILLHIKRFFFRENKCIEIDTPYIGGGLKILHKPGCVITAESIGENCQISQGVTIGKGGYGINSDNKRNKPIIGNNVMITTNAVVIGGITIGDNVVIGAGAVVTKDVPDNAIVVGNPARILKYRD